MGNFQWKRVPMGAKGSPSWFQQQLATKVLGELTYTICELYIDDIIIYADTLEEYNKRIRLVVERLAQFGITVNPKKCKFLMTEVEYVEYIVSKEGTEFSQEKKEHALSFELPKTYKALKSFVGLAEHFRRHANNFVTLARSLHQLLGGYTQRKNKHQAISWTPENEAAFYTLQKALGASQKLYFVRDDWEIHMDTDASEYGIGAYLYQKGPNNKQEPIAFISKTLQPREQNWSVPEREGYAIFHAVTKLEHLLRDVRFVLHTDHENLTYLNCGNSKKVMRWKLFIQEFNFDLEYVKGELNIIADGFSRLVPKSENGEVSSDDIIHTLASFHDFLLPEDKREFISRLHNSIKDHFGIEKTTQKLLDLGHNWTHMREHVKTFIKKCPCCQKMSYLKPVIHTHPFTLGTYQPMERVAIDTMGPLKQMKQAIDTSL